MPIQQTAKQAAINTAKQVARESNEFAKSAREQILPTPQISQEREEKKPEQPTEQKPPQKDLSFLNEYRRELEEIEKQTKFKELQQRIAEGEEVPLADYVNELSSEQREVLKAQMEAVRMQKEAAKNTQEKGSPLQVVAKKGRNAMMGMFKKKNETHVETRQPPSG